MSKLPDMGKMVGPLPLGAWIIVVGGGLGVMVYSRKKAPAAAPVVTDPGVGTGGSGQWTDITTPTTGSNNSVGKPTTNEEWGVRAINYLIANGYPPAQADQAIRKYLATEALGVSEVAMVTAALRAIGSTPQILPPPVVSIPPISHIPPGPRPGPRPAAKPYTYHTVKITETLPSIAVSYRKPITQLWDANRKGVHRLDGSTGILSSYALHRGQVLVIPWVTPVHL